MRKIQSYPFHLCCLAGPDAGLLYPLPLGFSSLGRLARSSSDTGRLARSSSDTAPLTDPATSATHLFFQVTSQGVEVADAGAKNPAQLGVLWHLFPGFARTWVWARRVSEPQQMQVGQVLLVGNNLFQLRCPDASFVFSAQSADATGMKSGGAGVWNRFRQLLMLVLPVVSLSWLASRFLPASILFWLLLFLALTVGYWGLARLQRRRNQLGWELTYVPHLPVKASVAKPLGGLELHLPVARQLQLFRASAYTLGFLKTCRQKSGVIYCEPGVIRLESPASTGQVAQQAGWPLTLALTGLLALRSRGVAAEVQADSMEVTLSAGGGPAGSPQKTWVFTTQTQVEPDLCLSFQANPPIAGGAIIQLSQWLAHPEIRLEEMLSVEDLNRLVGAQAPSERTGLAVPVGRNPDGQPAWLDLVADGPHALICGTTGSGKSVALRTWLQQLSQHYTPRQLRLILFDYKGGAALRPFVGLPHVEGLVTDLEPLEAKRVFKALAAELRDREVSLQTRGFSDLAQWRRDSPEDCPPRLLCVVDEYKVMVATHPRDVETLLDLTARGRSLGIHLLLATQSAAGVVTGQMRANLGLRVCFRTATLADSLDLLGDGAAAELTEPGLAWVSRAGEDAHLVRWAFTEAVPVAGGTGSPTLWLQALTAEVAGSFADVFAVVDDLAARCHRPLQWNSGVVAVVAGSEKTDLLQQLAPAGAVSLAEVAVAEWAVVAHNAVQLGQVLVVPDLFELIRNFERDFGPGVGREVFESWCRSGARILVGVAPTDFGLCRLVEQVFVRVSGIVAKQLGWEAPVWQVLQDYEGIFRVDPAVFMVLRWSGLGSPAGLGYAGGRLLAASSVPEGAGLTHPLSHVCDLQGLELYVGAGVGEELAYLAVEAQTEVYRKPVAEADLDTILRGCKPGWGSGFVGLNAAEVRALKAPYYLRNLLLEPGVIWICKGGAWYRYTN